MDKQELLNALKLYPEGTLQKLYDYANFILIPESDLAVNATMVDMMTKAKALATTHYPSWTGFDSKADFGRFLIELIALFSEKDFWYINAFLNEALLLKATDYTIVFQKSVAHGYFPILCKASTFLAFLSFGAGSATIYKKGDLQIRAGDYVYTNRDSFSVDANTTSKQIYLTEGAYFFESTQFNGHFVKIPKKYVDVDSIDIVIDNVQWKRVRTFGLSNNLSTDYIVLPDEQGSIKIFFGNGEYGSQPILGQTIEYSFIQTNGAVPVYAPTDLAVLKSLASKPVEGAAPLSALIIAGANPESIDSIRHKAIVNFYTQKTITNTHSCELFLLNQDGVAKCKAIINGVVIYFYVIKTDGTVADSTFLNELATAIYPNIVTGFSVQGLTTTLVEVTPIFLDAYILGGLDSNYVSSEIKRLIEDFTNPLTLADYGKSFSLLELTVFLRQNIAGLQNIVFTQIAGTTPANITVSANSILKKADTSLITVNVYEI